MSTGEDNDDLVDNLVKRDCITSGRVEHVFRAVDRGHYFTEECRDNAYKVTGWRGNRLVFVDAQRSAGKRLQGTLYPIDSETEGGLSRCRSAGITPTR